MQTFLPYPDFAASARCLDRARLGKQRIEVRQLLRAIKSPTEPWGRHPAAVMWRGYADALGAYLDAILTEWLFRGYKNSIPYAFDAGDGFSFAAYLLQEGQIALPPWLGNPAFHASHRSNLLRKDPTHYAQFGWAEPSDLPYVWPN